MKQPIRHFLRILLRLLILWAIDAIAMLDHDRPAAGRDDDRRVSRARSPPRLRCCWR